VQTLDFFTPIVDDPFTFGRIAAANALSDLYAMGAVPITALNIFCRPADVLDAEDAAAVLKGGIDALREADCLLLGGHTVDDEELKYGLAVTGLATRETLWTTEGALAEDEIVLTKPIGTGLLSTAIKAGEAEKEWVEAATVSMSALNRGAAEAARNFRVHACTDVTGFGLVGHLANIALASGVTVHIDVRSVPLLPGALHACSEGLAPVGLHRNRAHYACRVSVSEGLDPILVDLMFDPQTSGGLALVVHPDDVDGLLEALGKAGVAAARVATCSSRVDAHVILR